MAKKNKNNWARVIKNSNMIGASWPKKSAPGSNAQPNNKQLSWEKFQQAQKEAEKNKSDKYKDELKSRQEAREKQVSQEKQIAADKQKEQDKQKDKDKSVGGR